MSDLQLEPLKNDLEYLTAAIYGESGSGKTTLALALAAGIAERHAKASGEPAKVALFDTEKSVYLAVRPIEARLARARVQLVAPREPGRQFAKLLPFLGAAAEAGCVVAVIDSATHLWRDVLEAMRKQVGRAVLRPEDRELANRAWRQGFADHIPNLELHLIVVGRAGDVYDDELEEEGGPRRRVRTGIKMAAGGETVYEPLLTVETERVRLARPRKRDGRMVSVLQRALVVKDKTGAIQGRRFDWPTWSDFAPVVEALDGKHVEIDTTTSEGLFEADERRATHRREVEAELEEIKGARARARLGRDTAGEARWAEVLVMCFGTSSWTSIAGLPLGHLKNGRALLFIELGLADREPEAFEEELARELGD